MSGNIHILKVLEAPLNRLESVLAEPDTASELTDPAKMAKPVRGEIVFKDVCLTTLRVDRCYAMSV